jgi:hypothetical protein
MAEDWLQLYGGSHKRRALILHQRIKGSLERERVVNGKQLMLDLADPSVHAGERFSPHISRKQPPACAMGCRGAVCAQTRPRWGPQRGR